MSDIKNDLQQEAQLNHELRQLAAQSFKTGHTGTMVKANSALGGNHQDRVECAEIIRQAKERATKDAWLGHV